MEHKSKHRGRIVLESILAIGLIAMSFFSIANYFEGRHSIWVMRTTVPEEISTNLQYASDHSEAVQLLEAYIDQPESVPDSLRSIYKELFQEVTNPTTDDVRIQELVTTLRTYNDAQQKTQTAESLQTTTVTSTTQE